MMRYLLLLLLVTAVPADAQAPDARVETSVKGDSFLVGQRVPIYVKLLTTTTFAGAAVFDLPSLPGALLMKVQDRPLLGSETDRGTSYISQTHELALFAQRPGVLTLPAFTVRFASTDANGGPAPDHRLQTQPVIITAALPKGAQGAAPFLVGGDVSLTEQWQPQIEELNPGDAVTRTVTLQAVDVPAMMLPSLTEGAIPSLRVYPRPPELVDQQERGAFTGRRTERVTYVAGSPGPVTVPPIDVHWWNADTGEAEVVELPGRTFTINAITQSTATTTPRSIQTRSSAWPILVSAGILFLAGAAVVIQRGRQRTDPEVKAFAALKDAMRSGDARRSETALFRWLDQLPNLPGPATVAVFCARAQELELVREVDRLLQAALDGSSWDGEALSRHLGNARTRLIRFNREDCPLKLAPLNPSR